jgi:tetratricopeptide (TPR) repeat protein
MEATLLTETGKVDDAVALIKKRIASGKQEPSGDRLVRGRPAGPRLDDDFSNYIFISQLFNQARRGADAASAADQAYQVAGSSERKQIARLMTATALQTAGQFGNAESILRDILKTSPGNPIALNNLGYFLVQRGERLKEALGLIQQAISIDPTNPSYLDSLGWVYFKLGRTDEAIAKLEEAARLDDTSSAIHEHLGDAYRQKGSLKEARSAWQRAVVLTSGPSDVARIKEKLDNAK